MSSSIQASLVPLSSGIYIEVIVSQAIHHDTPARVAVLLHPWSRLGGSMNDPTLQALVRPFQERNYHVMRFNSRGVGRSTGRPSWTGAGEVEDLQDLLQWGLKTFPEVTEVVLFGYSHGSLISTRQPVLPAPIKISYAILSYPLSPRGALTLFNTSVYQASLVTLVQIPGLHILLIYGTEDEFTAEGKYETWVQDLKERAHCQLQVVRVEDATHFWQGEARSRMHEAVFTWVDNLRLPRT